MFNFYKPHVHIDFDGYFGCYYQARVKNFWGFGWSKEIVEERWVLPYLRSYDEAMQKAIELANKMNKT